MRKFLIVVMVSALFMLCSCGSAEEPTVYEPTDIQVEASDDGNIYFVQLKKSLRRGSIHNTACGGKSTEQKQKYISV